MQRTLPNDIEIREACLSTIRSIEALLRLLQLDQVMKITWDTDRLFSSTDPEEQEVTARSLRDLAGVLAGFGLSVEHRAGSDEQDQILQEARAAVRKLYEYADLLEGMK